MIDLDEDRLMAALAPMVRARAEAALALWESWPREQDRPGYVFAKTENPIPTLDVDVVPGYGFVLTIRGAQVEAFEDGNGPGPIRGRPKMFIKLAAGGSVEFEEVNSYEGTKAWFKSVRQAFAGD